MVKHVRSWWAGHPRMAWSLVVLASVAVVAAGIGIALAVTQNGTTLALSNSAVNGVSDWTFTSWRTGNGETIRTTDLTVLTFPANVDVSGVTGATVNGIAGTVGVSGQQVTISNVTLAQRITYDIVVSGVRNPSHPSAASGYPVDWSIQTSAGTFTGTFTDTAATAFVANATAVTADSTALSSTTANDTPVTYTVGFTTGADGRISGTTAAGADTIAVTLSGGGLPGSPTVSLWDASNDTTVTAPASVAGNTVTVTLPAGRTIPASTAVRVAIEDVTNPAANTYTASTVTSAQSSAGTSGYTITGGATTLAVASASRPAAATVGPSQMEAVDGFTLARSAGSGTISVTGVTVTGTNVSNVAGVYVYRDDGDNAYDSGDTRLNTAAGAFSGATANVAFDAAQTFSDATPVQHWVVYVMTGSPTDGATVTSQITAVAHDAASLDNSAVAGNAFTVDSVGPATSVTDPASNDTTLTGSSRIISGTASDARSTVSTVSLTIRRGSDDRYWDGAAWQAGVMTLTATYVGPSWTYNWDFDPDSQDSTPTYAITAWASDSVLNTGASTQRTGIAIDNAGPTVVSATTVDPTHVDVLFSEPLAAGSIQAADFAIGGGGALGVSGAALQPDTRTVRLTCDPQTPGTGYTVTVAPGAVTDLPGNGSVAPNTAAFTGYGTILALTSANRPAAAVVLRGQRRAVDGFTLQRSAGTAAVTVTGVTVRDMGTSPASNVTGVYVYRDTNGNGTPDIGAGDTLLNAGAAGFAGTDAAVTFDAAQTFNDATAVQYWVAYEFASGASDAATATSLVSAAAHDAQSLSYTAVTGDVFTVDAAGPTASISDPAADGVTLTGASTTISGTATDTVSGVGAVRLTIRRGSDGRYWTGGAWQASATTLTAAGTTNWTYGWTFAPASQNGTETYAVSVWATDTAGFTGASTQRSGIRIDNTGATVVSATAVDATHVDVLFSEALAAASVGSGDFVITGGAGLTVSGAVMQADTRTVRLTTTSQVSGTLYTVSCASGSVTDLAGTGNPDTFGDFDGYTAGDEDPPTVPGSVEGTVGQSYPVIALLDWTASTDDVGVAGYRIYRSTEIAGPFASIGTTEGLSYEDRTGVTGQAYYYRVTAYDAAGNESAPSAVVGSITATWTAAAHTALTRSTNMCQTCHSPHVALASSGLILRGGDGILLPADVCLACHDGSGALSNVKTGAEDSFALQSGHALEQTQPAQDLTNECWSCHSAHSDRGSRPGMFRTSINGTTVTAAGTDWCGACHDDDQAWYVGSYPSSSTVSRDASGYPTLGTYPGITVYLDPGRNAHVRLPAASEPETRGAGDCLYCHAAHRAPSKYDSLVATFGPSTPSTVASDRASGAYAAVCFACHDGGSWEASGAVDVKRYVTRDAASEALNTFAGHRVKSAGGLLPVNAPLPCYDCHNPHGSRRGNDTMLSDTLGANLTTSTPSGVRSLCLSCHSTSDAFVWDSVTATYAIVAPLSTVEGLLRNGGAAGSGPDGGYNWLRLKPVNGHAKGDSQSCYVCHGSSYADSNSNNTHNPGAGESSGGANCFSCHAYQAMQSGSSYHHYVATDAASPYPVIANPSTLTTSSQSRSCLTCHVDHDYFAPANAAAAHTSGRAQNLRTDISSAPSTATATYTNLDFDEALSNGGVCTSCHRLQMDKNQTERRDDADRFADTAPITRDAFRMSAHNYYATAPDMVTKSDSTTFTSDASTFSANCSKCHNDEFVKQFQTGPYTFGTHDSDKAGVLTDGGQAGFAEDPQEAACWLCHSRSNEPAPNNPNGGTQYGTNGSDLYGGGLQMSEMGGWALDLKGVFTNAAIVSKHPIDGDGSTTARVECVNCHNVHKTEATLGFAGDGVAQDPDNTLVGASDAGGGPVVYYTDPSVDASRAVNRDYCLRCHDGDAPVSVNDGSAYVPYDVFIPAADEAAANPSERPDKSRYVGRSHFNNISGDTSPTALTIDRQCADCHDKHGSTLPSLLGRSTNATGTPTINGTAVTGNNNSVCVACHSAAPASPWSRDASGYPMTSTFPGAATYATVYNPVAKTGSMHTTSGAEWPGRLYAQGDCKNCHDVHGTANAYDELRTENGAGAEGIYRYEPDDFSFCFNCHESGADGADIERYYPLEASGTAAQTASTRFGHRTVTDGNLTGGSALPCYDCHNPHGSAAPWGLQVMTVSQGETITVGDQSGEITLGPSPSAPAVRNFCFTCHTTADTLKGWDGSVMEAVAAGDEVEGILRDGGVLRLPGVTGHNEADSQSCYTCHGNDYSTGSSNNVHNPSGGISAGGQDCYTCHAAYKVMDDFDAGNAATYHHVMGTSTVSYTGGLAPGSGSYPNSTSQLYCVSCHTDHTYFNSAKGANLRKDIGTAGSDTTNTDFIGSGTYGICVSCHDVANAKDTTNQKPGTGAAQTVPKVSGAGYVSSAHRYAVTSSFGGSDFNADCSKCHSDEQAKDFQSSTYRFGTHYSAERKLLSALGATLVDPLRESECFRCHSEAGELTGGKTVAGRDYYGAAGKAMGADAEATYDNFRSTASSHPVEADRVRCVNCHDPHVVSAANAVSDPDNVYNVAPYGSAAQKEAFCLKCHDGSAPTYRSDNTTSVPATVTITSTLSTKTTYAARGHWTASGSIAPAETQTCAVCHDNHGSKAPKLLGVYVPSADQNTITYNATVTTITANGTSVCYACHTSASSGFPNASENASGYPLDGRWPGRAVYDTAHNDLAKTGSMHADAATQTVWPGSTFSGGDCKNCHDVHGTANTFDELRTGINGVDSGARYTSGDFSLCFTCHDAGHLSGAYDVERYYPLEASGTAIQTATTRFGHRTVTDGDLTGGSALPCYDCHNPHGSASPYGLTVTTMSQGSTITVGDGSNEITLGPAPSAAAVRNFCFTCHTTNDTSKGWTGSAMVAVNGSDRVEGILRNGGVLHLPAAAGHDEADPQSCYTCHGGDYSAAGSNNVHNPSGGVSQGAQACYACHSSYRVMDDFENASNQASYHHVMGTSNAAYTGDLAPGTGGYPNSAIDVYCVSCHTDHNYFNDAKGSNLRTGIGAPGSSVANSDYIAGGSGICISCHTSSRAKDTGNQKNDGYSTTTPKILGAPYDVSSHQYAVQSSYGAQASDEFNADCSKCHNDEQAKTFQSSSNKFGTHFSADRRLLESFGAPVTDPVRENDCFGCHSEASDTTSGTTKPAAGWDAYGTAGASMDTTTQRTFKVFKLGGSSHGDKAGLDYVSCASCHNPHTTSETTKVADPMNVYNGMAYGTLDQRAAFCLRCHKASGYPVYASNDSTWVPITMGVDVGWQVDIATNGARGHWSAYGSISAGERVSCDACHDKHGSRVEALLGRYDVASGENRINGVNVTANDKTVCYACHTSETASYPAFTRLANGYPTDGTWPGSAVADSYNKHTSCVGCHNVHGSSGLYDGLADFSPSSFTKCFTCHSSVFPAWGDIKRYYPASAGGTSLSSRAGHRTISNGNLVAGSPLPCYDCHQPHGSPSLDSLQVVTMSEGATITVGDGSGEITMTATTPSADSVRNFCFTCHTTNDTTKGWNGSAMRTVGAGDQVEGISRSSDVGGARLHLPPATGHNEADSQSCYDCHGNDYTLDTSNNVHNPSGGVSQGAQGCYTCHSSYQVMDAADAGNNQSYHHVVGISTVTYEGGLAPGTGAYPNSADDLYCVSCHTDHNYFNTTKGANLRTDIAQSGDNTTNTDFIGGGTYGICVSCHTAVKTKDTTNQASSDNSATADPTTRTPSISGAKYAASAHSYEATSGFGGAASDTFRANCSKCHSDEQAKPYQVSAREFGTHYSAARHVLSAFGAAVTDPLEENHCYGCHRTGGDAYGGAMGAQARSTQSAFGKVSRHPVDETREGAAGGSVTTTYYPVLRGWSNTLNVGFTSPGNALGGPDALVSNSGTGDFDMQQDFLMPAMDTIVDATVTVRSQARDDGWGRSTGTPAVWPNTNTSLPTGDGGSAGFTTAPLWSKVDETAGGDADYIVAATDTGGNAMFTYAGITLPSDATSIAVAVYFRAQKVAAQGAAIQTQLRVNGVNRPYGATINPANGTFTSYIQEFPVNPGNGNAPWTRADIMGTSATPLQQFGLVGTDFNPDIWVSQCYMVVWYQTGGAAGTTNDDYWAVQYTTDGSAWTTVAASTAPEAGLTSHTVNVGGVLTPANAPSFRVRVKRSPTGASDASSTVDWESSTLEITYANTVTLPGASGGPAILCESCHNPHVVSNVATVTDPTNSYDATTYATAAAKTAYCLDCHTAAPPSRVLDGMTYVPVSITSTMTGFNKRAFEGRAHWTASGSISGGETQSCAVCHDNHGSTVEKLLGVYVPSADQNTITYNSTVTTITANGTIVCYACHTSVSSGFPNASENASGYPIDGRWPGRTVYTTVHNDVAKTGSMHTDVTTQTVWPGSTFSGGDCKNCHDVHGTANTYDELRTGINGIDSGARYTPADFSFCFTCHDAGHLSGVYDIERYYPTTASGTADPVTMPRSGHRTVNSGRLPGNSALPCYDCHNPHGSVSAYGLQVVTMSQGATITVGDAVGELAMGPNPTAANVRNFCFTCHTTNDTVRGWTGSAMVAVNTSDFVEGIRRDGGVLRLPATQGHNQADADSCYKCHGGSYASATSSNVHNPSGGVSAGGTACYGCHTDYQVMEDNTAPTVGGAGRTGVYHHTMGGNISAVYTDGDVAPNAGTYPSLGNSTRADVFCVSCHTDHNYFNANKGANLRQSVNLAGSAVTNTDFIEGGAPTYGVCASCHDQSIAKDNSNQKPGTGVAENTPIITAGDYDASAHQYSVTTTFGTSPFNADCSKCHDDENATDFQSRSFGVHYTAVEKHLLAALGVTTAGDEAQENLCYKCHTTANGGRDGYVVQSLNATAQATLTQFGLTGSKHPVVATANGSVECQNCHNVHENSLANKVSSAANTYVLQPYSTVADRTAFCFGCHSSAALPTAQVNGTTYVPATVVIAAGDQALMNKSTYSAKGHWTANGSLQASTIKACGDCHDNHASNTVKLLGLYDVASGQSRINGVNITANNAAFCIACHTAAGTGYPLASPTLASIQTQETYRDGTGYFSPAPSGSVTAMRWPGSATWTGTRSPHYSTGKTYGGKPVNDCNTCHDPHGTANTYDQLTATYDSSNFTLCFNCHNGSVATTNVAQFYPVSVGGSNPLPGSNAGHQIKTAGGKLGVGAPLPCYDCHVTHGSKNGNTTLFGDQRWDNLADTRTDAAASRKFCLGCHVTNDNRDGYGNTLTASDVNNLVEGLPRLPSTAPANKLKLSSKTEHGSGNGSSCQGCHGGAVASDYSVSTKNNTHNPSSGTSSGGAACYGCHTWQEEMEDNSGGKLGGATNRDYYHHVMGGTFNGSPADGDVAPNTGTYPMLADGRTNVFCVSCHLDHNYFNATPGSNLRLNLSSTTAANSDFPGSGTYGICLSCHNQSIPKDTGNQKAGGSSYTPALGGDSYDVSAHDYGVTGSFGGSNVGVNCSKCHDDGQTGGTMSSTEKFGTHYSAENRILVALGAVNVGATTQTEENLCYECHTGSGTGPDGYGVGSMSAGARGIQTQMGKASKHNVATYQGKHISDESSNAPVGMTTTGWWGTARVNEHVECEDCHNVHEAKPGTYVFNNDNPTPRGNTAVPISEANKGVWGADPGSAAGNWNGSGTRNMGVTPQTSAPTNPTYSKITTSTYEFQMCLKCHSRYAWGTTGTAPNVPSGNVKSTANPPSTTRATGVMTDVGMDFNPMNFAVHPLFRQGYNQPGTTGVYGYWDTSSRRRDLNGAAAGGDTGNGLSNTFVDGWSTTSRVTCSDCHGNNSWAANDSQGPHGSANPWLLRGANTAIKVTISGVGTPYLPNANVTVVSNYCINCHRADVYGAGDNGNGDPGTTDDLLSRAAHLGGTGGMRPNCSRWDFLYQMSSGCNNCHGGRANDGGVASGLIHGSAMLRGDGLNTGGLVQDGGLIGDPMGIRFMNGASWDAHTLGTTSSNGSCNTLNSTDNYSGCTQHKTGTAITPRYDYTAQ